MFEASEMIEQGKSLATKSDSLNPNPRAHKVGEENQFLKVVL